MPWTNKPDPLGLPSTITDETEREGNGDPTFDHHNHHNALAAGLKEVVSQLDAVIATRPNLVQALVYDTSTMAASAVVYDNTYTGAPYDTGQEIFDYVYTNLSKESSATFVVGFVSTSVYGTPYVSALEYVPEIGELLLIANSMGDVDASPAINQPGLYVVEPDLSVSKLDIQPEINDRVIILPNAQFVDDVESAYLNFPITWDQAFDLTTPGQNVDNLNYLLHLTAGELIQTSVGVWSDPHSAEANEYHLSQQTLDHSLTQVELSLNLIKAQSLSLNSVVDGGAVYSTIGLDLDVDAGVVNILGSNVSFEAASFSLDAAESTFPIGISRRVDAVVVNDAGVVSVVQPSGGLPSGMTDWLPADDEVLLGLAVVTATNIVVDDSAVQRSRSLLPVTFSVDCIATEEVTIYGWPGDNAASATVYLPSQSAASANGIWTLAASAVALTDQTELVLVDEKRIVVGASRVDSTLEIVPGEIVVLAGTDGASILTDSSFVPLTLSVDCIATEEISLYSWPTTNPNDITIYLPNQSAASANGIWTLGASAGYLTDQTELVLVDEKRIVVGASRVDSTLEIVPGEIVVLAGTSGASILTEHAPEVPYAPTVPADWVSPPDEVAAALDELAQRITALEI
jgi:hypothetical protein